MRVIFVATVLSALSLVLHAPSYADEGQPDKVRDLVAETAEKLSNDELSPDEKAEAINRLRELLNREAPQRDRAAARPSDRPEREREIGREQQERGFELLEQARGEFDEAIRRLESIPRQQGFTGPPPGERRGEDRDRRGDQFGRREAGPGDERDARPMEPPRMPNRPFGNFLAMQPPRFAIGIALLPKESDSGEGIVIDRVMEKSPAEVAGLRKDDVVISADNRELGDPQQLAEMVQKAGAEGRDIQLIVRREGETFDLSLRPQVSPEQDFPPGVGSISIWDRMPGQPPVLQNQLPPGVMPLAMGQHEREMEKLRRRMETMQRQIDVLRDQVNKRSEAPEPRKQAKPRESAEPKADPSAADI